MDNIEIYEIEQEKCACRGSFLDKFLQPALLVTLEKGPAHGFQLISDMEKSGMVSGDSLDPAGMYRTLKKMEAAGLVSSEWDVETTSKPRRIYQITPVGRGCLKTWQTTLLDYRENLNHIIDGIGKIQDIKQDENE